MVQTAGRVTLSSTFQCSVVAAVRGTDNGSCHFHSTLLAALCGAGVCLFFLLNVVYLPIYATRVSRLTIHCLPAYNLTVVYCNVNGSLDALQVTHCNMYVSVGDTLSIRNSADNEI